MRKACVIGHPIGHSLSPVIHGFWIDRYGVDARYERADVAPRDLSDFIGSLMDKGYVGANVTIPHKEAVVPLLDRVEPDAQAIGAVNTLWFDGSGALVGDNSDRSGFFAHLAATCPDWHGPDRSVLVVGAGGAARAILSGFAEADVKVITVVNRNRERAQALVHDLACGATVMSNDEAQTRIDEFDLIVNSSALGMTGQPPVPLSLENVGSETIVCDIVFSPLETPLLRDARARGLRTVDGLGMLLHQAVRGFEAWFGVRPEVDAAVRDHVLDHLAEQS